MTFVIKGKYVEPHICDLPRQEQHPAYLAYRLTPGDLWKCDDCGVHHVWGLYWNKPKWFRLNERQTAKIIKRHLKGKPFKQYHESVGGP